MQPNAYLLQFLHKHVGNSCTTPLRCLHSHQAMGHMSAPLPSIEFRSSMAVIDGWAFPGTQDATKGISVLQEAPSKHVSCKESHSYKGNISKIPLQRKARLGDSLFTHAGPAIDVHPLVFCCWSILLTNRYSELSKAF